MTYHDKVKQKIQELVPEIMELKFIEILGHPIQLADVLRAIEKSNTRDNVYYSIDTKGYFFGTEEIDKVEVNNFSDVDAFVKYISGEKWDLSLPFDDQSEETKDFIGGLLGMEK